MLDQLPQAVAVLDADARLRYWNLAAAALLGAPPALAEEAPPLDGVLAGTNAFSAGQRETLAAFCRERIEGGEPDAALRLSHGRGRRLAVQVRGLGGGSWMLLMDDGRAAEAARGASDAWLDPLTGLSNRRQFNQALQEAASRPDGTPFALLVIDLDRFKAVNDRLGHPVGDALLCLAAQRLRREVRDDDLLARSGGDSFTLLARSAAAAEALAARIVDLLGRPFLVEGGLLTIGASVGIACHDPAEPSGDALLHRADLALYDAKAAGGGTWRGYLPAMAEQARQRRAMETGLRRALALGELSLDYRPRADGPAGAPPGFEAVPQWNDQAGGAVPPGELIALAERAGCTAELGEWMLSAACAQAARWPSGAGVTVAVSPRQLDDCARLLAAAETALLASGLAPSRLELAVAGEPAPAGAPHESLERLRARGVRIAAGASHVNGIPLPAGEIENLSRHPSAAALPGEAS